MSLQRPPNYAPRITILSLILIGLLGVGFNVDAVFGPIPEAPEEAVPEVANPGMASGTDFDMESQVAKVLLDKATEALLKEATSDLPPLPDDWEPATLPRDEPDNAYVEDDDEAEYYDELDQLNTVLKSSNNKEREALTRLFDKDGRGSGKAQSGATQRGASQAKSSKTKTLAMRPSAAVITKKKAKTAAPAHRTKTSSASRKPSRASAAAAPKTTKAPAPAAKEEDAAKEEAAPAGPVIDPNASAKELIAQGRKLLLSGNPTTAEKAYRLALTKSSTSARARYGLAKALYQKNRATEATAELRKILSANKNHGPSLLMMGSLLQEQGQSSQARTYYQRYLDARPNGRRADEVRSILGRL
jgi:tetratricopeptide (TPR) repeat protein